MTFKTLLYLVILLCATKVVAQNSFCGKVIDAKSGKIIKNVAIEIPELNQHTFTNDSGQFCLKLPNTKRIQLLFSAEGYAPFFQFFDTDARANQVVSLLPSEHEIEEIVVYGNVQSNVNETSNSIDKIDVKQMRENGALNLSDGIAQLPGVRQLNTGPGISKPVVRGLYGNRVQTVLFGIRFDNQQWQDEHGLGLSNAGISEVEIIKGPSSLFYGSEAMGGVISILPEKNAEQGKLQGDVSTQFFSNTYGYAVDAGLRKTNEKWSLGLRLSQEAHADYSDGHGFRVLNSRFGGSTLKANAHYHYKKFSSDNTYYLSKADFGFLMDAYQLFGAADDRLARTFERPHHEVLLNLISSQNTWYLKSSKLKINVGSFFNDRQEQEGSGGVSLYMLLNSYSAMLSWIKSLNSKTELIISSQNQYQTNKNIGSRIIVPDAHLSENSLSAFIKYNGKYMSHEGGIRYDYRAIRSTLTGALNTGNPYNPGYTIVPISKQYNCANAAAGSSLKAWRGMVFKLNLSSGYRSPNLAEFSSNGLHEGSLRYEIGNLNLKIEQNVCADFSLDQRVKAWHVYGNVYYNAFKNYIYLQGTSEDFLGFTIFRYLQKDATIAGYELGAGYEKKFLEVKSTISGL
jgi:iron complex outermembrane receptor protein